MHKNIAEFVTYNVKKREYAVTLSRWNSALFLLC